MRQTYEGDDAGIDGAEQQHFEGPDRVDYETEFEGMHSIAPCCEFHARTATEDSDDNTGDSTSRPSRSISSVKTERGPGEEQGEQEEESHRAYQAGAEQPSGSTNPSGPAASVRAAYRPGEKMTLSAYFTAAGRRASTRSSSHSSDFGRFDQESRQL